MTLQSLLDRAREATGADRELDLALATALVPDVLVLRQRDDDSGADPYTYWEYTASIDASLALVERLLPGHGHAMIFGIGRETPEELLPGCIILSGLSADSKELANAEAPTLPLAIICALLAALSAKGDTL